MFASSKATNFFKLIMRGVLQESSASKYEKNKIQGPVDCRNMCDSQGREGERESVSNLCAL